MTDVVDRYLAALAAQDWDALRRSVTDDIVREGPYRDDVEGGDAYVAFLRDTFTMLGDYVLEIHRRFVDDERTCVELAETATVDGKRLLTEEAVVFATTDGRISGVRVFLQRSTPVD
ncbi:MAG: nuclear transport factor 2 family protein [Acidimicrobiia bacterium]